MSTTHERPGVYSAYDASSVVYGSTGAQVVGAVGWAAEGTAMTAVQFTAAADADELYGSSGDGVTALPELVRAALKNGASSVVAVPAAVGDDSADADAYAEALAVLADQEDVAVVICDSTDADVQAAVLAHVQDCSDARKERIAVLAGEAGETVSALIERAAALNSERIVLTAPAPVDSSGDALADGTLAAAAVAGAIAGESDPALPLGGAELAGLSGLECTYTDDELDLLIPGGVTPLESVGGVISVVRGVTTRTTTSGVSDSTWRELSTIRIIDNVIPDIRDALRLRFARTKNTAQTRSAIASQVIVLLEDKVDRQIIESYDSVTAEADEDDPTVCVVEFNFAVVHGLNQIHISAHITV